MSDKRVPGIKAAIEVIDSWAATYSANDPFGFEAYHLLRTMEDWLDEIVNG